MTEVDFERKYTYDDSIKSEFFSNSSGLLESFGSDLQQVMRIAHSDPLRLWTMVDGSDGMYLVQGYHIVNRIYYVVTNERATEDEEYLIVLYSQEE